MGPEVMKRRTKAFAVNVVQFAGRLPRSDEHNVIKRQLLRCSTSVGANYRAACLAKSIPDFISKLGIAVEEADESHYWMELLVDSGLCQAEVLAPLMKEAAELTAILVASRKTAGPRNTGNNQQSIINHQ